MITARYIGSIASTKQLAEIMDAAAEVCHSNDDHIKYELYYRLARELANYARAENFIPTGEEWAVWENDKIMAIKMMKERLEESNLIPESGFLLMIKEAFTRGR